MRKAATALTHLRAIIPTDDGNPSVTEYMVATVMQHAKAEPCNDHGLKMRDPTNAVHVERLLP